MKNLRILSWKSKAFKTKRFSKVTFCFLKFLVHRSCNYKCSIKKIFLKIPQIIRKHLCRNLIFDIFACLEHMFSFAFNSKSFTIAFFFLFLHSSSVFGQVSKSYFSNFSWFAIQEPCNKDRIYFIGLISNLIQLLFATVFPHDKFFHGNQQS